MKKMVNMENDIARVGKAMHHDDAMQNTSKTFDTPLVAKVGETVFYLNPKFIYLDDSGNCALRVWTGNIIRGTVYKIDCATECSTCLHIKADGSEDEYGAVQELFFHSFEEAAETAIKVNHYTDAHPIWEGGDWYEIYKGLFQPHYHYTLRFPLTPLQTQKVWKRGGWHHIIPNRVIAYIEKENSYIEYQGKNTKPLYIHGRQLIETFKPNYSYEYKIEPINME